MAKDDKMRQILESLENGVRDFFTSDKFSSYLDVMSKFHHYSINNQLLIAMQRPDATYVAGYNSWIKNFDRHVTAGEKGITILAPTKRLIEVETDQADEYGNAIVEKREILSFRPVTVFDVNQTEGKELPQLINNLEGKVENFNEFMSCLRVASPYLTIFLIAITLPRLHNYSIAYLIFHKSFWNKTKNGISSRRPINISRIKIALEPSCNDE